MKKGGRGFINALRYFCVLVVFIFGLLAIISSGGGGGGGDDGGTADNATYDATGTWNFIATIDLGSIDTNFECIPGDSPEDDTRTDTLIINQTGNNFSITDSDGHTFNGTIDGATYTFTGSWIETDDDGDYTIVVSGSFTLSSSNSFSGSGTISGTNEGGNYCEWDETYNGTKQSTSTSLTITGKSGNPVNLDGTWKSGCNYDAGDEEAEKWSITVSGSNFTQLENLWLGSATCSGASDITVTMNGSVILGDEVTASINSSNVTATEADVNFTSYTGTINNATLVPEFNADQACGFSNWVVDTPKNLLGTSCGPDSNIKDILYIDDTADPDVWYNGDGDEGPVDANGYPTNIDSDSAKERM